jgi:hypothetical protein
MDVVAISMAPWPTLQKDHRLIFCSGRPERTRAKAP